MPHDPRVSYGVAILLWRSGHLLLLKRKGAHAADHWACPGGWVDYGETAPETVVREAKEELGVKVCCGVLRAVREERFRERALQSLTLYYNAYLEDVYITDRPGLPVPEPQIMEPEKCSELRWVNPLDPASWPHPLFPNLAGVLGGIRNGDLLL